ncbi:hypothetical protein BDR03DRAFT_878504 [Suillus americanus]|nr:hypothetical protein BDR03DRAFT_878504 [Suillus americanus]
MDEKKRAGSAAQETKRCHWSSTDELWLLDYITTHKARGGDGLNFDKTFWAQAALDVVHTTTISAVKTADACQQKWTRICHTFSIVNHVAKFLGIAWSNECGANIMPESELVWTDLVKVCTYILFLITVAY